VRSRALPETREFDEGRAQPFSFGQGVFAGADNHVGAVLGICVRVHRHAQARGDLVGHDKWFADVDPILFTL
jgi:hypothetical protein